MSFISLPERNPLFVRKGFNYFTKFFVSIDTTLLYQTAVWNNIWCISFLVGCIYFAAF